MGRGILLWRIFPRENFLEGNFMDFPWREKVDFLAIFEK